MLAFRGFRTASPVLRQVAVRRYASSGSNLSGAADNAFNRERQAVKEHAAGTAGMPTHHPLNKLNGALRRSSGKRGI